MARARLGVGDWVRGGLIVLRYGLRPGGGSHAGTEFPATIRFEHGNLCICTRCGWNGSNVTLVIIAKIWVR